MKFETTELSEEERQNLPGSFVKLSMGYTHYELVGPDDGSLVVLVHGFSSPMFIWDHTISALVEAGYRVLRYDLYGRGFSDRPQVVNDEKLFEQQLFELVTELNLTTAPFHLLGLSMGGIIVSVFTKNHNNLLKSLILVAPAGTKSEGSKVPRILTLPILGKLLFKIGGNNVLLANTGKDFQHPENFPEFPLRFAEQMRYKGFGQAIHSTMCNFDLQGFSHIYDAIAKVDLPKMLFWGEIDATIPYPTSTLVRNALVEVEFQSMPNCGHMPQYENPEMFNGILIKFLKKNS